METTELDWKVAKEEEEDGGNNGGEDFKVFVFSFVRFLIFYNQQNIFLVFNILV